MTEDYKQPWDLCLMLTKACNGACPYCFQHDKNNSKMSFDMIKKIIDRAKTFPRFNNAIDLFGGEPTIDMKLIKDIMDAYPEMTYSITTNGLFMKCPEPLRTEVMSRIIRVHLSIETSNELQKEYRKTGDIYKYIDDTVGYLLSINNKSVISFNITPTKTNIFSDEFENICKYIIDLEKKHQRVGLLLYQEPEDCLGTDEYVTPEDWLKWVTDWKYKDFEFYKRILDYNKFMLDMINKPNSYVPCEADSKIFVRPNGELVQCTHSLSDKGHKIGTIFESDLDGIMSGKAKDNHHIQDFLHPYFGCYDDCPIVNKDLCRNCNRLIRKFKETGDMTEMIDRCAYSKIKHYLILELINNLEEPWDLHKKFRIDSTNTEL